MLQSPLDDFIRIYPNILSKEVCTDIINFFDSVADKEEYSKHVVSGSAQFSNISLRKDKSIFLNQDIFQKKELCVFIFEKIGECLKEYTKEFVTLQKEQLSGRYMIKVQRSQPGDGFNVWHHENGTSPDPDTVRRELAWMLYLNDMPEGEAETEFLYQRKRINPVGGSLVLWPAGFTHTHRGNTVFTKTKYILTGWVYKEQIR